MTNVLRLRVAERRTDTEVSDAGETPSVVGAGPEPSASETSTDTRGAGTPHRRGDDPVGAGQLWSVRRPRETQSAPIYSRTWVGGLASVVTRPRISTLSVVTHR